jgi:hypothetical protein
MFLGKHAWKVDWALIEFLNLVVFTILSDFLSVLNLKMGLSRLLGYFQVKGVGK